MKLAVLRTGEKRSCNCNCQLLGHAAWWCELTKCQMKVSTDMAGPVTHKQVLVAASLAYVRIT